MKVMEVYTKLANEAGIRRVTRHTAGARWRKNSTALVEAMWAALCAPSDLA